MIYRDQDGFLTDETIDGMDSCIREAMLTIFNPKHETKIEQYVKNGTCFRHPGPKMPQGNPKNFSKDQLLPLMAALYTIHRTDLNKQITIKRAKRLFFCQNTERDLPGSTKYPWPHVMKNGDQKDNGKLRLFDFADPLFLPDYLMFFFKASNMRLLYYLTAPLGLLFLVLKIIWGNKNLKENNQMLCVLRVLDYQDLTNLYEQMNPDWYEATKLYWHSRNEHEYADHIGANF